MAVHHIVDPFSHFPERSCKFVRRNLHINIAGVMLMGHMIHIRNKFFNASAHCFNGFIDECLLARKFFKWRIEVSLSEFLHTGHRFFLHCNMTVDHFIYPIGHLRIRPPEISNRNLHINIAGVVLV